MEESERFSAYRADASAPNAAGLPPAVTIDRIRLERLFGLYTYDVSRLGRSPILYGENGVGKTNILKILFHLLSPAGDAGHRTALAKIKFNLVRVYLSNNIVISAVRSDNRLEGWIRLMVSRNVPGGELIGAWDWYPKGDRDKDTTGRWLAHIDPAIVRMISETGSSKQRKRAIESVFYEHIEKESNPLESQDAFLTALRQHVPPIYFLAADRILSSDQVGLESVRRRNVEMRSMHPGAMVAQGREQALNESISMASRTLAQLAVRATSQGSGSMHSIYQDLLMRLASRTELQDENTNELIADLETKLRYLTGRFKLYAQYGLTSPLDGDELVFLLNHVSITERATAVDVLRPYVKSLTEQANSFDQAYAVIHTLIMTVNEFLYDKSLEFTLAYGLKVRNRLGEVLEPSDLSSGEQQLLLLVCHITMAHEYGGIFIIDEPEISLNVKWQRRLVDALLNLDPAKNLQFILASHSIEILTRHRENVISLAGTSDE